MSVLTIPNVEPRVMAGLRERAARHRRSLEDEVRFILTRAVDGPEPEVDFAQAIVDAFADNPVDLEAYPRTGPAIRD